MPAPSRNFANLKPYLFAQIDRDRAALTARGIDVISLGIGDPDQPTPPHIVDAMAEAIRDPACHQYPAYEGSYEFRKACADYMATRFGVEVDPETEVLALIGSKEGIANLHVAYVDPSDVVLAPAIGYPVYTIGATLRGAEAALMPMRAEDGWLADFDAISPEVARRAKLLFLGYPNNPTGAIAPLDYFERALAYARDNDILLAHDNAYADLSFDGYVAPSILQIPGAKDHAIEFFSLSKPYNMTGWRCGFAVGNAEAIAALGTVKNNVDSGQFTAIQRAGIAALTSSQDCVADMCALYQRRRDLIVDALKAIGVECAPPKATIYVWAKVPEGHTSASFAQLLLNRAHVVVTPGSGYGAAGEGYIRISLTTPDADILAAVERIRAAMG